jgi:hypothetical protein
MKFNYIINILILISGLIVGVVDVYDGARC